MSDNVSRAVRATNTEGQTPLHLAALHGHTTTIEVLLEANAPIAAKAKKGFTALHLAALKGHSDAIQTLMEGGADIDAVAEDGKTPLRTAAQYSQMEAVKILLGVVTGGFSHHYGRTALYLAALSGNIDVVQLLLDAQADAVDTSYVGRTALHLAAWYGHVPVVKILLDADTTRKTDIDDRDEDGRTALHLATDKGHIDVVELLLHEDANRNIADNYGWTPYSIASRHRHTKLKQILTDPVSIPSHSHISMNSLGSNNLLTLKSDWHGGNISFSELKERYEVVPSWQDPLGEGRYGKVYKVSSN